MKITPTAIKLPCASNALVIFPTATVPKYRVKILGLFGSNIFLLPLVVFATKVVLYYLVSPKMIS